MRNTLLITLIFLSSIAIRAQENPQGKTFNFNLQECLQYAYENQNSIKNAQLDIESAKDRVKETVGIGLPQISGTAQFMDYLKIPTTLIPGEFFGGDPGSFIPVKFGVKYQSSAGVSINQLVFNGTYLVGLRASKTYKELSEKSLNRTKVQTTVAVTKAYYQVLVSNEQMRLVDANVNQLAEQLRQTKELSKQGFVENIDLDRLQVIYNNLLTQRENIERSLILYAQMLKFQMGMPVTDNLQVKEKIENVSLDVNTSIAVDTTAYRNRIEYSLLQTQKKLSDLNVQRLKSEYLPSLAAFGTSSYSFQSNTFSGLYDKKFPTTVVGLQLNIPIFSGFQRVYQIRQAKIDLKKLDNDIGTTKNGILLEQESGRINYQNSLKSLNNQKANMDLAREVLRVSKVKYQEGVGSSLEVTQAQTELETAENNYIQALYNALVSKVDLDNAYGRIQ